MNNIKAASLNGIALLKLAFKAGLKIGYNPSGEDYDKSRVMLLNGIVLSLFISICVLVIAFVSIGYRSFELLTLLPVIAGVLFYNHSANYRMARIIFLAGTFLAISYCCYAARGNGYEYFFIILATTSTLIFIDKGLIYTVNILCAIIFISYKWYNAGHPFPLHPQLNYDLLPWVIILNALALVSFQVGFFRDAVLHYKEKLKMKYVEINAVVAKLKQTEEALRVKTEALNRANEQLNDVVNQLKILVRNKNAELETYVEAINVSIYSSINDLEGNFLSVNEPLVAMSGFSREELIGSNYEIMSSGHHSEAFYNEKNETVMAGKIWRGEVQCKKKDGSFFWSDCVVIPVKDENDNVKCFLSLGLPITERKEAELMRERTLQMLEVIAFETSHKLRGPLARIKGLSNLIKMDLINDEEYRTVADKLGICTEELDSATSGLVKYVVNNRKIFEG